MSAAIVGVGHSRFGRLEDDLEGMITSVAREALQDAGLTGQDIDAVWLGQFNGGMCADGFASSHILRAHDGLRFKPATRVENACASGSAAIFSAMDAIASGRIETALVVGAEKMTSVDGATVTRALGSAAYQAEEAGLSFPEIFAKFAKAYGEKWGDPSEAMAHVAAKNHQNSVHNPLAQLQKALDFEFCNTVSDKNPMIADPIRKTDCSLVSDGAAAIVLVSKARAKAFKRAAQFRAAVHISDYLPMSLKDLTAFEGPRLACHTALQQAKVAISDISFAEVHDCFTIAEILSYEAMGLVSQGQGAKAAIEGLTRRDGVLPVNISGGLKAKGHPVGATGVSMHVLAARQLWGEAGAMQLKDPKLGLCFNMGGGAVANYVSILERC